MSDQKRPYTKKRRAEAEAQTRRRITESAVALHGTVGPARTSISAVAEHAGVRRSTVYRHFADEEALLGACSAHWLAENPPPDVTAWAAIADPEERLEAALTEMYGYYRRTEAMFDRCMRDASLVPALGQVMEPVFALLAEAAEILLRGRGLRGKARRRTRAAIGHALAFRSWQQLALEEELSNEEVVTMMRHLIASSRHL